MDILILSGSIRSTQNNLDKIKKLSDRTSNIEEYAALCKEDVKQGATYCNSDILVGAALLAIRLQGGNSLGFSLANLFSKSENMTDDKDGKYISDNIAVDSIELQSLLTKIDECVGIVLVTPVYFGDRSSVANKLIQLAGKYGFLKNKVFGAATVGAKRNGGQETAALYCLFEALSYKALIVGNGPPTSQYGGTAIGGHRGTVANDEWGLTTTFGVASRVSQVGMMCKSTHTSSKTKTVRILILVTIDDSNRTLLKTVEQYISKLQSESPGTEFKVVDAIKLKIYRCIGCKHCPGSGIISNSQTLSTNNHASCIIKNKDDDMHLIQKELIQADGILIAGLNIQNAIDINYRYQVLIERTRYIRRDNFELSNKLISSFTLHEVGAMVNQLHHVKTVTAYIRHNVVMCSPVEIYTHNGQVLLEGDNAFRQFIRWASILKDGRKNIELKPPEYVTSGIGGYE